MTEPFNCPTCGAPLEIPSGSEPAVVCPYCRTSVILPEVLRLADAPSALPTAADSLTMRLQALLASGNKIGAIKLYRETYFVSLGEARDAVEAIEAGLLDQLHAEGSLPGMTASQPYSEAALQVDLTTLLTELGDLIRQGKKIEAIKRYRQVYGSSLKDALYAINSLEAGTLAELPSPQASAMQPAAAARLRQEAEAAEAARRAGLHPVPFSQDRSQPAPARPNSCLRSFLTVLLCAGLVFAVGLLAARCSGPTPEMARFLTVLH